MVKSQTYLSNVFRRTGRIQHAISVLEWDRKTTMPFCGAKARAECICELETIRHEILKNDETTHALEDIVQNSEDLNEKWIAHTMQREILYRTSVPLDLIKEKILRTHICEAKWIEHKDAHNWNDYKDSFRSVVEIVRDEAKFRQSANDDKPYDSMFITYNHDVLPSSAKMILEELKDKLPSLLRRAIELNHEKSIIPYTRQISSSEESLLNRQLIGYFGFKENAGTFGTSPHPFTTSMLGDVRITTRFSAKNYMSSLRLSAHEMGHALYEKNLPLDTNYRIADRANTMYIHESQAILFERHIFQSEMFFSYFFDKYISRYVNGNCGAIEILKRSNHVKPSFIRIDADEVTYPIHVLIRYEIEQKLINAEIEIDEVPDMWEYLSAEYLGIRVNYQHGIGCMQDIHWSKGSFGYFPSYALGAVASAQIFDALKRAIPFWQESLSSGSVDFAIEWLSENIWSKGSRTSSTDLIASVSGKQLSVDSFLAHLTKRYLLDTT